MRSIVFLVMLLAAVPAGAQDASDAAVDINSAAVFAASVHEEHCADTAGNDTSVFGAALAATSAAFVEIDKAYAATNDASLLYWRGLLALCINREDAGAVDLQAFLEGVEGNKAYIAQVKDAQRRLRRVYLSQKVANGEPATFSAPAGIATTIGLGAGAGVLGGFTAQSAIDLEHLVSQQAQGELSQAEADAARVDGPVMAERANVFIGATAGVGAGALVAAIITLATAERPGARAAWAPAPTVAVMPTTGGAQITVGWTW